MEGGSAGTALLRAVKETSPPHCRFASADLIADRHGTGRRPLFLSLFSWALCLLQSLTAVGQQDVANRVVRLQHYGIGVHGLEKKSGTSWCVDAGCSLLATNYHVAKEGLPGKIGDAKVLEVFLATGPEDYGSVWMMTTYGKWLRYNPLNDVALVTLSQPLAPGTHAASFFAGNLVPGQELAVKGFPLGGKQQVVAAEFLRWADGLLELSLATESPAGLSGSAVTDKEGRIIGMLSAVADGRAFALPLWSIADAIRKFRPALHRQLFPDGPRRPPEFQGSMVISRELLAALSGVSPDPVLPLASLEEGVGQPFPKLIPHPARLLNTREEPADVLKLRRRAQQMFRQMANLRALQTLRLNTEGKSELIWLHELYVDSDELVFRAVEDGQPIQEIAFPHRRRAVVPGGEWRDLPNMVANEFKLHVEEVASKVVGEKRVRVFRYQASVEDGVCWVRFGHTQLFWSHYRRFPVACWGEVWTDAELNPLRISQELEVPAQKAPMRLLQLVVLYGWLEDDLVPVQMLVYGTIDGHACRADAHFSNYLHRKPLRRDW